MKNHYDDELMRYPRNLYVIEVTIKLQHYTQ